MSKQITSLARYPSVVNSIANSVDLRTALSISPQTRSASSSSSGYGSSTTDKSASDASDSLKWSQVAQPQQERGRERTRRGGLQSGSQLQQLQQRSRSLPPIARPSPVTVDTAPGAPIVAYTDASCVNGRASGIGIYFGDNHPLNTSKALSGPEHNSGIAEIIAAQTALTNILEWKEYSGQPVVIRTDYIGVIDAMNSGNFGRFSGLYADLRRIAERFPSVTFEHVYGHDGEKGNEMADSLAREAIRLRRRTPDFRNAGARSRSRSRGNKRARSATVQGRKEKRKSPVKVSDTSKVPPPDRSKSRERKSRSRERRRSEVIKGVEKGRSSPPTRSVRSMQRSEQKNLQRRQERSRRSMRDNRDRGRRKN